MKITIKNNEYITSNNVPKGTKVLYNNESCVKTEKGELVGIDTGNVYPVSQTRKLLYDITRDEVLIEGLELCDFFIFENNLYILIEWTARGFCKAINLNSNYIEEMSADLLVEAVYDKNIQIKVK